MKKYYVYILSNYTNSTLYIGVTNNLKRRVFEHKNKVNKGFTAKYNVHKLIYYEIFTSIIDGIKREKQLKEWKRIWKNELIQKMNPEYRDLSSEL